MLEKQSNTEETKIYILILYSWLNICLCSDRSSQ